MVIYGSVLPQKRKRLREEKSFSISEVYMETGEFLLHGKSFIMNGTKLVIRKRKKVTDKPELYLIQLEPFKYVSSLFPVPGTRGEFTFDYERQLYSLVVKENRVEVVSH